MPRELCATFAVRSTLRMLPLLAAEEKKIWLFGLGKRTIKQKIYWQF